MVLLQRFFSLFKLSARNLPAGRGEGAVSGAHEGGCSEELLHQRCLRCHCEQRHSCGVPFKCTGGDAAPLGPPDPGLLGGVYVGPGLWGEIGALSQGRELPQERR